MCDWEQWFPCTLMLPGKANMNNLSLFNVLIFCSGLFGTGVDYFQYGIQIFILVTGLLERSAILQMGKNALLTSPSPWP